MTKSDIAHYRLQNQLISPPLTTKSNRDISTVAGIVSHLGAMQGQDYAGAKWAVGLRSPGSSDSDIEKAIEKREIIRTWAIRGTLHFVSTKDIYWMLELVAPKIIKGSATRRKQLELDDKTISKSHKLIVSALKAGNELTRNEIRTILDQNNIASHSFRLDHILQYAVMNQLISGGPIRNKEHTFVYLPEWVKKTKTISRERALAELAMRYFNSHGPATLKDFMWWSGLSVSDTKAGLEMIQSKLISASVNGLTYWMSKNVPELKAGEAEAIFLLPGFDEYMLGYTDRTVVVDPKFMNRIATNNGLFANTIVVNGMVEGTWKRKFIKKDLSIELYPFKRLNKNVKELVREETFKFGKFLSFESASIKMVWN